MMTTTERDGAVVVVAEREGRREGRERGRERGGERDDEVGR